MQAVNYQPQMLEILACAKYLLSNIKPSKWNEENRIMTSEVSPFPGKMSYDRTPYLKEVVDCLSPGHPARIVAVMKGAQVGFSTGVIEAAIGWIIAQSPGNILFLTGHADLAEEAMNGKIDQMIDSCGLRQLIKPNVLRKKNQRTGDTNKSKEFPGGSLVAGSAGNHKLLRQRSVRYGFIDDFDAAKSSSKESGSTTKMIEQRFAAYADKMKLYYISTPELKHTSNIEPVFLLGDQRRYFIPCPCCGAQIALYWSTPAINDEKEVAGIHWTLDSGGKLKEDSVGYICQECSNFFTDHDKYELNLAGAWKPTAEPSEEGYYSYHLSSLYAPPGMYDWKHYVRQFIEAHPIGQNRIEKLFMTFTNLCLGETYEEQGDAPKATELQKNIYPYEIGIVPEKISDTEHGNGKIVLLTCACDMNGIIEDARLDWEIVGWSETGSAYSIAHGSIGTFVPREGAKKFKKDRERWTYEFNKENSVWPALDKILDSIYVTDTGRRMKIFMSGLDSGQYHNFAYAYVDACAGLRNIIALKGDKEKSYRRFGADTASFRPSKERNGLYLINVNQIKDELAEMIKLKYNSGADSAQPPGFLNFPTPANGLYLFENFFSHYEAEHRVIESKDGEGVASLWKKKTSVSQNHMWDCRVYNIALKDILTSIFCKEAKIKNYGWKDYVNIVLGKYKA